MSNAEGRSSEYGDVGGQMAINVVNLDALIPSEDFAIDNKEKAPVGTGANQIDIHHLDGRFFAGRLRKPDFQRETAHWSPSKVVDVIRSFLDGDLIPAIVLWEAGGYIFVIDGAHRLSALLAWVLDDYGDKKTSLEYFEGRISDEQRRIAQKTRDMVNEELRAYVDYRVAQQSHSSIALRQQSRFQALATNFLVCQWAKAPDVKAAQDSFIKINQAATPIDPTELRIIVARDSANAIASRAITRAGTGHRYWKNFPSSTQEKIEAIGREIYSALYEPPIAEGPIKTLDLPLAGKGYSVLPFVFDLVNQVNRQKIADSTKKKGKVKRHFQKMSTGRKPSNF